MGCTATAEHGHECNCVPCQRDNGPPRCKCSMLRENTAVDGEENIQVDTHPIFTDSLERPQDDEPTRFFSTGSNLNNRSPKGDGLFFSSNYGDHFSFTRSGERSRGATDMDMERCDSTGSFGAMLNRRLQMFGLRPSLQRGELAVTIFPPDDSKEPQAAENRISECAPTVEDDTATHVTVATNITPSDGEARTPSCKKRMKNKKITRQPSMEFLRSLRRAPSVSLQIMVENTKDIHEMYTVEQMILGKGSYGSVKKAHLKATGATRAVKCVTKGAQDSSLEMRNRQEVEILKGIDHPNIIKLYELFEDEESLYIVMEICLGGNLEDHIKVAGLVQDAPASKAMLQIFRAVNYLHRNGIMHRDLKPANCLLTDNRLLEASNLRVSDFGLSCTYELGQVLSERVGTLRYMAPEVIERSYTSTCDVWSCGVITYYLLCGYEPFMGKTDDDIRAKVRSGKFEFRAADWAHVASETMSLIRGLLTVKTETRFTLTKALGHEWIAKHNVFSKNAAPLDAVLIANLLGFRSLNKLKRSALHIIASLMDEDTMAECRNTFIQLDTDHDGMLSIMELKERLQHDFDNTDDNGYDSVRTAVLGLQGSDDSYKKFTYTEFLAATLDRKRCCKRDACWAAFSVLDENADGYISKEELSENSVLGQITPEELEVLIEVFDKNQDGHLDFNEFWTMMCDSEGVTASPQVSPRPPVSPPILSGRKSEDSNSTFTVTSSSLANEKIAGMVQEAPLDARKKPTRQGSGSSSRLPSEKGSETSDLRSPDRKPSRFSLKWIAKQK